MKYVHNLVREKASLQHLGHGWPLGSHWGGSTPQPGSLGLSSHAPAPLQSARALAADQQAGFGLRVLMTLLLFPLGFNSVLGVFCAILLSFHATFDILPPSWIPQGSTDSFRMDKACKTLRGLSLSMTRGLSC